MVDITHKTNTLRSATATATVRVGQPETIDAIRNRRVPKGDVLEMAKTAGLFAVKKTSDIIPDCHPLPVEYTAVSYAFGETEIRIEMEVKTIYKTGVEVEAMHGVSVVALTMYDMLKPIDKNVTISEIKLKQKKGGKSNYRTKGEGKSAGVIVCSDTISAGQKEDRAGKAIIAILEEHKVEIDTYTIIPDEAEAIRSVLFRLTEKQIDLIIFTGGTGLSPRDVTPETLEPLLERRIPGVEEAIRTYGQNRMPYAMLSRSLAGTIGQSIVLALPGSTNGARESMQAVFPALLHAFGIFKGKPHKE